MTSASSRYRASQTLTTLSFVCPGPMRHIHSSKICSVSSLLRNPVDSAPKTATAEPPPPPNRPPLKPLDRMLPQPRPLSALEDHPPDPPDPLE